MCCNVLQCVAPSSSVFQCMLQSEWYAVSSPSLCQCVNVLQCVAVCCNVLHSLPVCFSVCCSEGGIPSLDILGAFCSVLRCIVVWVVSRHSIFFCVRVAACCSVLQCVSECVAVWVVSRHSICIVCVLRYVAACFTVSSIY